MGDGDVERRSRTGVPGLDEILCGGLIRNRIYLLDGPAGTGKTTLSLQYLLNGAAEGETGLYITLSETKRELAAVAKSHGWSLDSIQMVEMIADEAELEPESQLTMYRPSEIQLTETIKAITSAVERVNAARVIIDSLAELRLQAESSLKYRRQILALKQYFIGRQSTVLLLDDRSMDGIDAQLQSIAHGVLSLEQAPRGYGNDRRRLRVCKLRGTQFRTGYHDFTIKRGGLEVYPRLVAADHHEPFEGSQIGSGVESLDALLGGGPDRGTSTLVMGPAGSGKSTIAAHYAVAAARRGERAAVFCFDENIATLRARMAALGAPLDQGVKGGRVHLQQVDPAELSPGEFVHAIRQCVERDDARVIVIDSLNGYLQAMPQEQFLEAQMHELLSYLGRRGVTTFMVIAQHGTLGSVVQAPVDTSYLADSVILLRFFESGGRIKKAISVAKKRSGAHEDTIRELCFDSKGIHLSEPLTQFHGVLTGTPTLAARAAARSPEAE